MEVSNFYFILAKSFFHQTFWEKLLNYFCWRVSRDASSQVWICLAKFSSQWTDVTYSPDLGAHDTLLLSDIFWAQEEEEEKEGGNCD